MADFYMTRKECWNNFQPLTSRELSDFNAWAMRKAFEELGTSEDNNWFWQDGKLCKEIYHGNAHVYTEELCMTANGILFLRRFEVSPTEYTQIEQYVINMNLY